MQMIYSNGEDFQSSFMDIFQNNNYMDTNLTSIYLNVNRKNEEFRLMKEEQFMLSNSFIFQDFSNIDIQNPFDLDNEPIIEQQNSITINNKIFKVIYPEKLFAKNDDNYKEREEINESNENNLTKRFDIRRKRFKNADNILKKIVTAFLNRYLLGALNSKLRKLGNRTYFGKVPQNFLRELVNKTNRENIMKLSLKELFKKWSLFSKELKSLEGEKNLKINNILNLSLLELYELYINSDDFNINEINRLKKNKKFNEWYIHTYENLSKDFIKMK